MDKEGQPITGGFVQVGRMEVQSTNLQIQAVVPADEHRQATD